MKRFWDTSCKLFRNKLKLFSTYPGATVQLPDESKVVRCSEEIDGFGDLEALERATIQVPPSLGDEKPCRRLNEGRRHEVARYKAGKRARDAS
jgi:hypothetical protein